MHPQAISYLQSVSAEARAEALFHALCLGFSAVLLVLSLLTVILIAAALSCLIFCLKSTGRVGWSGIAALGMALFWVWVILPQWFPRWRPMIFLPIDFL